MPMFPKGRSAAELRNLAIWRIDRYVGEDSPAAFAQATSINRELESIRLLVQMHTEYDTRHPHLQALQVLLDRYIKLHGAAQAMQKHKQCTHILWHHAWGRLFWFAHKPSWNLNRCNWWMFEIMIKTATGSATTISDREYTFFAQDVNESQRAFDLRVEHNF